MNVIKIDLHNIDVNTNINSSMIEITLSIFRISLHHGLYQTLKVSKCMNKRIGDKKFDGHSFLSSHDNDVDFGWFWFWFWFIELHATYVQ